nr:dihydroxy-acid dehydratase [Angustibacter aerolatus]
MTDGRMSGASGAIPAAIHLTPEAVHGGPIALLQDGDVVRLDALHGTLDVLVDAAQWQARVVPPRVVEPVAGTGREPVRRAAGRGRPGRRGGARVRRPLRDARCVRRQPDRRPAGECPMTAAPPSDLDDLRDVGDVLGIAPVVPVVVIDHVDDAVPLANALLRGGIGIIEVTLRTPAGLGAIARIAQEAPDVVVGAGTVTTPGQVDAVRQAGARFLVTPGSPRRLLGAALDSGLPVLAGASTMTEMMEPGRARPHRHEVLPRRAERRSGVPVGRVGPAARAAVLPDRRHHPRVGAVVPGPAERLVRRRLVADPARRGGGGRLGSHRAAGPRGLRARRLTASGREEARRCRPVPTSHWTGCDEPAGFR